MSAASPTFSGGNAGEIPAGLAAGLDELAAGLRRVLSDGQRLGQDGGEQTPQLLQLGAALEETAADADTLLRLVRHATGSGENRRRGAETMGSLAGELDAAVRGAEELVRATQDQGSAVAESCAGARELSATSSTAAREGIALLAELASGIDAARRLAAAAEADLDRLREEIKAVRRFSDIIHDVAKETNLLSLNAAILAAQAGARGQGFSVLAQEIRELADRTALSTAEIATQVKSITVGVDRAVAGVGNIRQAADTGADRCAAAGELLGRLAGDATRLTGILVSETEQTSRLKQSAVGLGELQVRLAAIRDNLTAEVARDGGRSGQGTEETRQLLRLAEKLTRSATAGTMPLQELSRFVDSLGLRVTQLLTPLESLRETALRLGADCRR